MSKKSYERVGALRLRGAAEGAIYLLRDAHRDGHGRDIETLHVISKPAGGQVRGYRREAGSGWRVQLPAHEGHWPEVDRAVAALIGEPIHDLNGDVVRPNALFL